MSASAWKSAAWESDADYQAAYKASVYNAFAKALNERLHVVRDGPEMREWVLTSGTLDPRVPQPINGYLPPIGATSASPYQFDGAGGTYSQIRMIDDSTGTTISGAWQGLQGCAQRLRWLYVDTANPTDANGTPQSLMNPGATFPEWRRKYYREIETLSATGTNGQRARLCMEYWAYQAAPRPQKALTGRVFEHNGTAWTLIDDYTTEPDIVEATGLIQTGDIIGPWILDDLRDAILTMQETVTGTEYGKNNGADGLPNYYSTGSYYRRVKPDGTGYSYGSAVVRHNLNPYMRTTVSGVNGIIVAGNWNGTAGEVGNCYVINAHVRTGGMAIAGFESGFGRQAPEIMTALWGGVQHSTPWRRRSGGYNNDSHYNGSVYVFGSVTYSYTNTDYPPTPYAPSNVYSTNSMVVGIRGYYAGTSCSFSLFTEGGSTNYGYKSDITEAGGGAGNCVLSDTILFPYGMKAEISQYVKAEALIANEAYGQIEPPVFDAFGTTLVEGKYALLGTHGGAEYEWDQESFDWSIANVMNKQDGKLAAVGAKLGPSAPPTPSLPPAEYVMDEYRLRSTGYRATHAMRIYDWAVLGGFEYV